MGQKQKLFEDIADAMEWMTDEVFREFVAGLVQDRAPLVQRFQREVAKREKKLLTNS